MQILIMKMSYSKNLSHDGCYIGPSYICRLGDLVERIYAGGLRVHPLRSCREALLSPGRVWICVCHLHGLEGGNGRKVFESSKGVDAVDMEHVVEPLDSVTHHDIYEGAPLRHCVDGKQGPRVKGLIRYIL
jgi:hypothetical protein